MKPRRCDCGQPIPAFPGGKRCRACTHQRHQAQQRQWRIAHTPLSGPNQIAHCGQWHQVDTLPWRCPVCDVTLNAQ